MSLQAPHFIGWSTQLAQGVAAALLKSVKGTPVDLGSHRVIVPSSFASRLIQEELAKQSPNGVLLPAFQTPTEFLNWGDANAQVATEADALMAWIEVLRNIDRNDYQNLFPLAQDVGLDHQEAQRLAQTLFELRDVSAGRRRDWISQASRTSRTTRRRPAGRTSPGWSKATASFLKPGAYATITTCGPSSP